MNENSTQLIGAKTYINYITYTKACLARFVALKFLHSFYMRFYISTYVSTLTEKTGKGLLPCPPVSFNQSKGVSFGSIGSPPKSTRFLSAGFQPTP